VPLSTEVELDVAGSQLTSVSPQLLSQLDDRQRQLTMTGLQENPIFCDCNTAPLRRWLRAKREDGQQLPDGFTDVRCAAPAELAGQLLADLPESELSCSGRQTTTTTEIIFTTRRTTTTAQPDIIWTLPPARQPDLQTEVNAPETEAEAKNMDALIIGIVGGVVALIILVIVCVCVCRLCCFWRWDSSREYQGGPLAGPLALRQQGGCTCLKPGPPPPQWNYLTYPGGYPALPPPGAASAPGSRSGTLKMLPPPPGSYSGPYVVQNGVYGTLSTIGGGGGAPGSARGFYANAPYYVTFPTDGEEGPR